VLERLCLTLIISPVQNPPPEYWTLTIPMSAAVTQTGTNHPLTSPRITQDMSTTPPTPPTPLTDPPVPRTTPLAITSTPLPLSQKRPPQPSWPRVPPHHVGDDDPTITTLTISATRDAVPVLQPRIIPLLLLHPPPPQP